MTLYRLTPAAEDDLFEIWAYIASENLSAADRVESEIFDAGQFLAEWPEAGHFRTDLTDKPVRFFPVRGTYLIVYDPSTSPLQILRVLHGARDVRAELEG